MVVDTDVLTSKSSCFSGGGEQDALLSESEVHIDFDLTGFLTQPTDNIYPNSPTEISKIISSSKKLLIIAGQYVEKNHLKQFYSK